MKKLIVTFCMVATCGLAAAQDIILKKNADEIQAKVLKVGQTEIEYKKWENVDGPTYTISTNDVFTIKYQNGSKDVISNLNAPLTHQTITNRGPRYQGEIAVAYGLGVGEISQYINTNRIVIETVHGVRINPYFFAGLGTGFNYLYAEQAIYDNRGSIIGSYDGGGVVPAFINTKGYLPITNKCSIYLSLDLGAAFGVAGWTGEGTEFYTSVGPGINFGKANGHSRGDFSIRFQHMGEGLNAVMFRLGFGF